MHCIVLLSEAARENTKKGLSVCSEVSATNYSDNIKIPGAREIMYICVVHGS